MITKEELMDVLEEIGNEVILLSADHKKWVYKRFEKHGLIKPEPTAKEKWEEHKAFLYTQGYVKKGQVVIFPWTTTLRLADAAIAEAEEKCK